MNCPTVRKAALISGASEGRLKQITESARRDLENAFQMFVRLKIVLHVPNK